MLYLSILLAHLIGIALGRVKTLSDRVIGLIRLRKRLGILIRILRLLYLRLLWVLEAILNVPHILLRHILVSSILRLLAIELVVILEIVLVSHVLIGKRVALRNNCLLLRHKALALIYLSLYCC